MVAMPQREVRFISEDEFLTIERSSNIKHEYFRGEIFAMSGGSNKHALIGGNTFASLHTRLRGKTCRPVNSDQLVKIESTGLQTYPDISVYCQPARFEGPNDQVLLNPVVIVEVLSPSTAAYDRGEKFEHYKHLSSLQDYVIVWQDRVRIEHYHRLENDDWLLHTARALDEALVLPSIACDLPLSEVYEGIEVPTEPLPLRPQHQAEDLPLVSDSLLPGEN